jgi:catechol 2,3-dioxygenase-like lactoylglutathione lyase family enzyme
MIKRFNHVGVAVKDLDRAVEFFEKVYGATHLSCTTYEEQKMESTFEIGVRHN